MTSVLFYVVVVAVEYLFTVSVYVCMKGVGMKVQLHFFDLNENLFEYPLIDSFMIAYDLLS